MIPHVHHEILPRMNIEMIINCASSNEIICIVAPYGCGKTLAVVSWLGGRQAAWITLDEGFDNEETFFDTITRELSQNYNSEKILVIDNFHFIKNSDVLYKIKKYIYSQLRMLRIIIISRSEIPPIFNDLIIKKHICLITIKELNFSPQEIADYFRINGYELPMRDVIALRNDTEGWPAALNVVLVLSRSNSVRYKGAARSYVMGFFETEIWMGLDDNIKDFLLKTSVLTELTPASCRAVTDIGATLPTLNRLFQNGLFISRLNERYTYQYHCVFRDFLSEKLIISDIDEELLYKRAAWWMYEKGEIPKAFTYFFKARYLYGIDQTLKIINPKEMGIEKFLELISCITELNVPELKPYPVIIARMALVEYLRGNISEMQSLYHTFEEWVEPGTLPISAEEYAEYVWEVGWLCYLDPDEQIGINKKHLEWANYSEYVPHLKELHLSRAATLRFPSILRGIRDYSNGVSFVEEVLHNSEKYGFKDFHEEHSIWETYLLLAEYKYETEDFIRSEDIVKRIMPLVEKRGYTDFFFVCTALLVKLMRVSGNTANIEEPTNKLEKMIIDNEHFYLLPNFHAFKVRNRLALGQTGFTDIFTKENEEYKYKTYFYLLYRHFTLVRGLISLKGYNEAMIVLGNLELLCRKYNRAMDLMDVNILKAITLHGLGQHDGACRCLTEAIESAKSFGYIRLFSDNAKALWPILDSVRKQIAGRHVKKIVVSCKKSLSKEGYKFTGQAYSHIKLTKTELNVLKLLQTGMSYEEIALNNNIRISTVKTHAHSIYSKLDVDNKTSAVLKAQGMGLLEKEGL